MIQNKDQVPKPPAEPPAEPLPGVPPMPLPDKPLPPPSPLPEPPPPAYAWRGDTLDAG